MNEVRHHIIHQQLIDVDLPRGRSAAVLQERVRNTWYDMILPGLDNLFSSLVDEGVIIRIDKLFVDLGEVSETKLEQQLTAKALESIEKILKEKLRFEVGVSDGVSAVPVRKADAEILLHFLVSGRLPWWSPVKDLDRLEATMMEEGALPSGFSERFLLAIGDPAVMRRLSFQFSRRFLQFLAAGCIPSYYESEYATADPAEALTAFSSGGPSRFSGGASASEKSAATAGSTPADEDRRSDAGNSAEPGTREPDGVREQAGAGKPAAADYRAGTDKPANAADKEMTGGKELREESSTTPGPEAEGITLPGTAPADGRLEEQSPSIPVSGAAGPTSSGTEQNLPGRTGQVATDKVTPAIPDASMNEKKRRVEKEMRDDEALYIELAGLVILHPFVKPFFEALGLIEGRAFRDEASLHKAVHLLGYLATGETDIQEQRLILPKLFCGMAWATPIERTGIITEADKMEAENLLTTAISHWKALKNASPGALREGFLQREGRLTQRENGWQLDVEKKTLDILMGSMPWGISMVKYPWMKTLLFVNWG